MTIEDEFTTITKHDKEEIEEKMTFFYEDSFSSICLFYVFSVIVPKNTIITNIYKVENVIRIEELISDLMPLILFYKNRTYDLILVIYFNLRGGICTIMLFLGTLDVRKCS